MRSEAVQLNTSADNAQHKDMIWERMLRLAESGSVTVPVGKRPANINQPDNGVLQQIAMYRALKRSGQL